MLKISSILHNLSLIFYVIAAVYALASFGFRKLPRAGAVAAAGAGLAASLFSWFSVGGLVIICR